MSNSKDLVTLDTFLKENSKVGMDNVSADDKLTPYLKVVQGTSKDTDAEGRRFPVGKILYTGTGEAHNSVNIVILTYVKIETPNIQDKSLIQKQYKVGGVIGKDKLPFIMFVGGSAMGQFKKYVTEATKMKRPFFSLNVLMTTEKRSNDKGEWYVPVFQAMPNDDLADLQVLKGLTANFQELLNTEDVYEQGDDPTKKLHQDVDPDEIGI